jgi:hypothetical protein
MSCLNTRASFFKIERPLNARYNELVEYGLMFNRNFMVPYNNVFIWWFFFENVLYVYLNTNNNASSNRKKASLLQQGRSYQIGE